MHRNPPKLSPEAASAMLENIGANGRWFCVLGAAIAIAGGDLFRACVFAIVIGACHVIELLIALGVVRHPSPLIFLTYIVAIGSMLSLIVSLVP
jgi:membrane associated rhomboid family serine protease